MNLYINSVKADFTLEDEKTLGDVLKAFEIECEKNDATVVSVSVDGENIKAEDMDAVFARTIDGTAELKIETVAQNDIIRSLRDTAQKVEALSGELEQIPLLLQSGKDAKAAAVLTAFADLFDVLCRTISLCALFPQRFAAFTIDGKNPADFLKDFSPVLSDFEKSLADGDTVLTGDLAEYEIAPRLRAFAEAVKNIKEPIC